MTNDQLTALLNKVFDRVREDCLPELVDPSAYNNWRQDFVFHMTDWMQDLERLRKLFNNPEQFGVENASHVIVSCLIHVIPHLNAAGRLLLDEVSDPFASIGVAGKRP